MNEFNSVLQKYDSNYVRDNLTTVGDINAFAATFFKDVADIYDALTRVKNPQRNPSGFSSNDAPILGLLVRIWKLLKEIVKYYEANNGEFISVLERPLIEATVIATYLLRSDPTVVEDYRKCSYKERLRILNDLEGQSPFAETKAGQRLMRSIRKKMAREGLTSEDFGVQKRNRWKLQGKSFFAIFSEVVNEQMYPSTYGMMSESIHGSWNESMDYCLFVNDDGTFSTNPSFQPVDIRFVTPIIRFCNEPFRLWLARIDAGDESLLSILDWIERVNTALFYRFDETFDG